MCGLISNSFGALCAHYKNTNEHFDIKAMEISSGAEAGQRSKGNSCFPQFSLTQILSVSIAGPI